MPMDSTKYPAHWNRLRTVRMQLAQQRCECVGECGSTHGLSDRLEKRCDAPHRARIIRSERDPAQWHYAAPEPGPVVIRVVLTIAHLCQDSTCGEIKHLRAFCQRCHLRYDSKQHVKNASATRYRQREEAGQTTLLKETK